MLKLHLPVHYQLWRSVSEKFSGGNANYTRKISGSSPWKDNNTSGREFSCFTVCLGRYLDNIFIGHDRFIANFYHAGIHCRTSFDLYKPAKTAQRRNKRNNHFQLDYFKSDVKWNMQWCFSIYLTFLSSSCTGWRLLYSNAMMNDKLQIIWIEAIMA